MESDKDDYYEEENDDKARDVFTGKIVEIKEIYPRSSQFETEE
jgi:hypothetical protein